MNINKYISTIIRNWRDPMWWEYVLNLKLLVPILFRNNDGIYIFNEQWDNLIILDACRYDIFKEEFKNRKTKGKLEYRISRGTDTPSFLMENFNSKEKYNDIIYLSTNPYVEKLLKGKFYKIVSVWKECLDKRYTGVPPKILYEYAVYYMKKYSNKKLIIHFTQPHSPYPNGTGETYAKEFTSAFLKEKIFKLRYKLDNNYYVETWPYIGLKTLKVDKLKEGYRENLKLDIPYIKKLINILPGRTIVTADHGEAFGERLHPLLPIKVYGHPPNVRIPALVKVPWLIVEEDEKTPPDDFEKEFFEIKKKFEKNEDKIIKNAIKNLKLKGKL
ncbi:hypothetical protein [Methanocaldococcus sp.]|uniref:hypothetical protein n=1 Tax=Methanocaldococcus sp. TaxID=2152917 RepID=UPI0026219A63|nr:hypothetical protein [Methanocaldococcus sp.]MCQ6254055.1 LTA synthase family protein [Methanocaldococcus sp.]